MKKIIFAIVFSIIVINGVKLNAYVYDEEDLISGINSFEDLELINDEEHYRIWDFVIKDEYTVIIGAVILEEVKGNPYNYDTFPFINIYCNNEIIYTEIIKSYGYGIFSSCLIENNDIVVLGAYEDSEKISQVHLLKINFKGIITERFKILGDANSFATKLFSHSGRYYFVGTTFAGVLGDVTVYENYGLIYAVVVEKDFSFYMIGWFGNDGNNILHDAIVVNNIIYVYATCPKNGYFNVGITGQIIIGIDERVEKSFHKGIYFNGEVKILGGDNKIILTCFQRISNSVSINEYNISLDLKNTTSKTVNALGLSTISLSVDYYISEKKLLITNFCRNDSDFKICSDVYDENYNNVFQIREKTNKIYKESFFYEGNIYLYGDEQGILFADKILNIKLKDNKCLFNGVEAIMSFEKPEEKEFGFYDVVVTYSLGKNKIDVNSVYYQEPVVNVDVNQTYDLNHTLQFNGQGFLNNKPISNNHIITEAGTYLLEVVGKNERVYYTFEVKKICIDTNRELDIKKLEIIESLKENNETETHKIIYTKITNETREEEGFAPIFIVIALIGLMIGCFGPLGGKKNA